MVFLQRSLPRLPRRLPQTAAVRAYAAAHGDHGNTPSSYKPEWLKIAREWPHENPSVGAPIESLIKYPSEHPDGSETSDTPASFFTPFWKRTVLLAVGAVSAYQANTYLTADQEVHPITRLIASFLTTSEESMEQQAYWIEKYRKSADDFLVMYRGVHDPANRPVHRVKFPYLLERASDRMIVPGTECDLSDLKVRHSWQEDDALFGVPFPKDE